MTEINYKIAAFDEFVSKIKEYFEGIDSIIEELEAEKLALTIEKDRLETTRDFTTETLKRKATIGNELNTVNAALKQAQEERNKIQDKYWTDISNEAGSISSEQRRFLDSQLIETEKEIEELLLKAAGKVSFIKNVYAKGNSVFNGNVTSIVNDIVGAKHGSQNSSVLSIQHFNRVDDLTKRVNKLRAAGKIEK